MPSKEQAVLSQGLAILCKGLAVLRQGLAIPSKGLAVLSQGLAIPSKGPKSDVCPPSRKGQSRNSATNFHSGAGPVWPTDISIIVFA